MKCAKTQILSRFGWVKLKYANTLSLSYSQGSSKRMVRSDIRTGASKHKFKTLVCYRGVARETTTDCGIPFRVSNKRGMYRERSLWSYHYFIKEVKCEITFDVKIMVTIIPRFQSNFIYFYYCSYTWLFLLYLCREGSELDSNVRLSVVKLPLTANFLGSVVGVL